MTFFKKVNKKIKKIFLTNTPVAVYDFNKLNPLGGNGERVDIQLNKDIDFDKLDIYQKNHWRRYEFARDKIEPNHICGDFACGTGYGSIMLADKAGNVTGVDVNTEVISTIKERYRHFNTVSFLNENLLNLTFTNHFDSIISFETLEHFDEANIIRLFAIFNRALKQNGKLIFSTPYMQEQSEEAIKMGFHLAFNIDEKKIENWLKKAGFKIDCINYQNYDTHNVESNLEKKEFIVCVAHSSNK